MKRRVVDTILAVALVGSLLVFPTKVYAATIEGEVESIAAERKGITNKGTVGTNYGQVVENVKNKGTIDINEGEVVNNYSTVNTNNGTVKTNKEDALITTNNGTVTINKEDALITTNNGIIEIDYGNTVTNAEDGTVENAFGTVTTNEGKIFRLDGTVETNADGGEITKINTGGKVNTNQGAVSTNYHGTIDTNQGTVGTNNGTITENAEGGTIGTNQKPVTTNNGTIGKNYSDVATNNGTIENNYSNVTTNAEGKVKNNFGGTVIGGEVENNFGGTVNEGTVTNNYGEGTVTGGTAINQWYEYIINGGKCKSASDRTVAEGKTWIGKAASVDEELGSYYITVAANSGMAYDYAEFEGGETATGTLNADGSYTFGHITKAISIFFKRIISNTNNSSSSDDAKEESVEALIAREAGTPITEFTSDVALGRIPEAARRLGASYNLSSITTVKGFAATVKKIAEAVNAQNAGKRGAGKVTSVTIYSDTPMNFTDDILQTIEDSGIDFIFIFMYEGEMYKVTIPGAAKIDFDGHICEGPLFIGKLLGTTEVIK